MIPTREQAAAIFYERRNARKDLVKFASRVPIPGCPISDEEDEDALLPLIETQQAAHHVLILQAIQKCMETKHGRLMIFAPPGSAKSTYASVVAPTWKLGIENNYKIILASYGSDLAKRHGRRTRQLLRAKETIGILQTTLSKDSQAADDFRLENGSEYIACGILSGITGNRAHGIIIDDPVKGRQDADSPAVQDSTCEAYNDDIKTRLIPGGWIVLIQTRWNENDLSGKILPSTWSGESGEILCRDGFVWTVLCLQAECQTDTDPLGRGKGEMLWPEWFDERHWQNFRTDRRTWASLYQQIPAPDEGLHFRKGDFGEYDSIPDELRIIGASDNALTPDNGDFTEQGILGIAPDRTCYLLDWWRGQVGPDDWVKRQVDMIAKWNPLYWFGESGQIRRSTEKMIEDKMDEENVTCRLEYFPSVSDKLTNAQSIIGLSAAGRLMWPRNAAWKPELQRQCLVFPAGSPDDGVDTLGLLGRGVFFISGVQKVYDVDQELISIESFQIPKDWPRLCGSGKFLSWLWAAHDKNTGTIYIYDALRTKEKAIYIQAAQINSRERWIPVSWPLSGYNRKQARHGEQLAQQYIAQGVNMRSEHAQFPQQSIAKERKEASISPEAGVQEVLSLLQTGKLKIFSHLHDIFVEMRNYIRKDGEILDEKNEYLEAIRMIVMDIRHAITEPKQNRGVDHGVKQDWFF